MDKFKRGTIITMVIAIVFTILFTILGSLTWNKYWAVELPEELSTITADSLHPDILYGWRRSDGTTVVEMRNYKH